MHKPTIAKLSHFGTSNCISVKQNENFALESRTFILKHSKQFTRSLSDDIILANCWGKTLKKTIIATTIILLTLICLPIMISVSSNQAYGATVPTQLKIIVGPTNIPADNNPYSCLAVQLLDSRSNPARAPQDLTVSLSSSLTKVGDLTQPTITIPSGQTFVITQFQTTFSPGTTTITATASGYRTVQGSITTVGPNPSSLVVYGFPSTLPADAQQYPGAVIVQIQDSSGNPAKAPNQGLTATLTSSNPVVGTVDAAVTIAPGQTFATATFTSTQTEGTTTITATATGYTSKLATFTTQIVDTTAGPSQLKIYLGPPKIFSDRTVYRSVLVELLTTSGKIAKADSAQTINLASSLPDIGIVDEAISVPLGQSFTQANFQTTYKPGSTVITATGTGLKTTTITVTTVGNIPTKLAVYPLPASIPADGQSYDNIVVQLQDSSGKPAKDLNGDVNVNVFSSTTDAGDVAINQITIPFGQTSAQGTFISGYSPNSTAITAQSSNYATGQGSITTFLIDQIPLSVSVSPDLATVYPGKNTTIHAFVTYNGIQPAANVGVTFTSNKGGNFTTPKYEGNGTYSTVFTTPKVTKPTYCNVTANVTKTGYLSSSTRTTLTVSSTANPDMSNLGTIKICIVEKDGTPITDATLTSTNKPSGSQALSGSTNDTGFAVFSDATAGSYTFQVSKSGYDTQTQDISISSGQTTTNYVTLTQTPSNLIPIVVVIVVVAVLASVGGFFFYRRRKKQKKLNKFDDIKPPR